MSENVGAIEYYIDANTQGLLRAEKQVDKSTRRMERDFDKTTASTQRLERGLGTLSKVAGAVITTIAIRQVTAYADAFTNVQNRLKIVTNSSEELADVTQKLGNIAKESRSNFESAAILYSRTARATEELGISQERLLGITSTITKSFTLSGATAEEANNAIRQLSQGLASGALRGEEFNSVAEQAPEILRAVSKETGKSVGELRDFAAEGGITAELLISAIENYADTVDREFAKSNATFSQSAEVARTNAIEFVGASDLISSTVTGAGDALVALSENLDALQNALLAGAAVLGGRFLGSLTASTQALVKKSGATIATTKAELSAAKAAQQRALSDQAAAQRSLEAARNDTLRSQALTRLAAANQAVVGTTNAATAAQARYNAVASIGTKVARGLRGAMALLGGPAGLIFTAASALTYFATQADDASDSTAKLKDETDELIAKFNDMNQAGKTALQQNLATEASKLRQQFLEASQEASRLEKRVTEAAQGMQGIPAMLQKQYLEAVQRAKDLEQQLTDVGTKQAALFDEGIPDNWLNPDEQADEVNEKLDKITQSIKDQLFAIREGQQAYDIMIAQRKAGVDAASEEGQEIARLIKLRDQEAKDTDKQAEKEQEATAAREDAIDSYDTLLQRTKDEILAMTDGDAAFEQYIQRQRENAEAAGKNADEIERVLRAKRALTQEQEAQQRLEQTLQELRNAQLQRDVPNDEFEVQMGINALGDGATSEMKEQVADAIRQMQDLRFQAQLTGQSLEEAFKSSTIDAVGSLSDGLADVIVNGGSAEEVLKNVARTMVQQLISAMLQAAVIAPLIAWMFPGAVASMSAATAAVTSATASLGAAATGGGKLYGGNVEGGKLYPVTENGRPELLTQGNKQYLLPGSNGRVTSNRDMTRNMTNNESNNINLSLNMSPNSPDEFRRQLFDNRESIYNLVKQALNDRGRKF